MATVALVAASACLTSCSTAKKKTTPELSKLEGKKVALISIDGEETAKKVIEVSLVNQLLKTGYFELIEKEVILKAKTRPEVNPLDVRQIAKTSGADYALEAKVLDFTGEDSEGFNKVTVNDSQMAKERGEKERMVERLVKVKKREARVAIELTFTEVAGDQDKRVGVAGASESVTDSEEKEAIHLPPKLRLLESVAEKAFAKFFEEYK